MITKPQGFTPVRRSVGDDGTVFEYSAAYDALEAFLAAHDDLAAARAACTASVHALDRAKDALWNALGDLYADAPIPSALGTSRARSLLLGEGGDITVVEVASWSNLYRVTRPDEAAA